MVEREYVVTEQRIGYEGLFLIDELHKTLVHWLKSKRYDPAEKLHTESVKPDGKHIDIDILSDRSLDDYTKFYIRVRIYATGLKEVTVEQDGRKKKFNQGKIQIVIDAWIETDYLGRMENKPIYSVLKFIHDKYIKKSETAKHEGILKQEVAHLRHTLTSYLNLFRMR